MSDIHEMEGILCNNPTNFFRLPMFGEYPMEAPRSNGSAAGQAW